ncbi:MAG: hybrid sensor histidine kinase/response regulator, partial [Richelia sp. SM1_7_0]|nr:hybrid sensor histidine kinase/response regulator [Richelia sp. SM1_7_0]
MKISTKFIGLSAGLVGAIALISGGSTLWRNQIQHTNHEKYSQALQRMQATTLVQNRLYAEILELKDHVLFRDVDEEEEDEFDQGIKEALDLLQSLVST